MLRRDFTNSDIEDIGKLFNTPQGKKVLKILDLKIYNTVSFVPGEAVETGIFKDGQRDLVHIFKGALAKIQAD
ncbi:MAG: hypothetical protein ACPKM1_15640 [Spirochaetaceae bacterium]